MKKLLLLPFVASAVFLFSCSEKEKTGNATIYGKLSDSKGDTLYLVDVNKSSFTVLDSVITGEDGSFVLKPQIPFKGFYNIDIGKGKIKDNFAVLILEPGDSVKFTGDAKNIGYTWKTEGSKECARFAELNNFIMDIQRRRDPLKEYQDSLMRSFQVEVSMTAQNDSAKLKALDKKYGALYDSSAVPLDKVEKEGVAYMRSFIDKEPGSFANIPGLRLLDPWDNFPYYEKTITALEVKYKEVPNVKMLRAYIERERPYCVGQATPEIVLNNRENKPVKLSSMKGKVTLIDFWASWCGPCREELPNVVAAYKKYHDKGFDVFSVSYDDDTVAWSKAIKTDGLVWTNHVRVIPEQVPIAQSVMGQLYRFKGIPYTVLIDRDGKIIDKNLRGAALDKKLAEIFDEPMSQQIVPVAEDKKTKNK